MSSFQSGFLAGAVKFPWRQKNGGTRRWQYGAWRGIDFDVQTLEDAFHGSLFDASLPAVFIWEGVTQYISEEAVRKTLSFVGKSASGGILLFTYVLKSVIERRSQIPGADRMMDPVAKNNAAWVFGLEPASIPEYLQAFHLTLMADVESADYQE